MEHKDCYKRFTLTDGNTLDIQHLDGLTYVTLAVDATDRKAYEKMLAPAGAQSDLLIDDRLTYTATAFGFDVAPANLEQQVEAVERLIITGRMSVLLGEKALSYLRNPLLAKHDDNPLQFYRRSVRKAHPISTEYAVWW
ncbi:MAG: hypothetical protein J0L97_10160 [Alphaproteobacteria bacterium]|nr:hypothetical protein [Alphaproteobacteria bacterium]